MKREELPPELKEEDIEMQNVDVDKKPKFEYTPSVENLIHIKADECQVLAKIHLKCHEKFKAAESYYNIPIITITALVGFASALDINFKYMNIVIGLLSLFVSLLKSYFSYLQISQKNENHRVSYLQFRQIADEINIEMSLTREMRQPAAYMMHLVKVKMRNLKEVSLIVPEPEFKRMKSEFQTDEMVSRKNMSLRH